MNSLINRLNVKTSSLEGDGVRNIHAVTSSDVAAALSFSRMPDISCDLIRAKCLNENTITQIESLANRLIEKHYPDALDNNLMKSCAVVAVVEFCKVPADYKPSGYNRAKIIGISETTYRRLKLVDTIKQFTDLIDNYYAVGRAKLGKQFAVLKNQSE